MTLNANWKNRSNKEAVREIIFQHVAAPLSSYLTLPGWDNDSREAGQCIQLGIKKRIITPETKVVGYDSDPAVVKNIREFFRTKYPDYNITTHEGMLQQSRLKPNSLDFAFLDFTGNMDESIYDWMRRVLAPAITAKGVIAITQPFSRELSPLFRMARKRLTTDLSYLGEHLINEFELWGERSKTKNNVWGRYTVIAVGLAIVKCALRDYHVRLADEILVYHDGIHTPMYAMIFDQIHTRTTAPIYPELISGREDKSMTNRSKAAFKAHETRRANALAAKRTATAKKAWRTRRANAA
jgi:hypothetical protein